MTNTPSPAPHPADGEREFVYCEDCGSRFPGRYYWEPSLPPHRCAERQAAREVTR